MRFRRSRSRRPDPAHRDFNEAIYHRPPVGMSFAMSGVIAVIVILIVTYLAFVKELPFGDEG